MTVLRAVQHKVNRYKMMDWQDRYCKPQHKAKGRTLRRRCKRPKAILNREANPSSQIFKENHKHKIPHENKMLSGKHQKEKKGTMSGSGALA